MTFRYVKILNFLSFGNIEQKLNLQKPGLFLVLGHNELTGDSNGAGKCVSAGTKITTKEFGEIKIDDLYKDCEEGQIYIPDDVHVKTDEGWKKIQAFWKTEPQELYEIETDNGNKLIASKDHKIMTDRGWVKLKNLKESDRIVIED